MKTTLLLKTALFLLSVPFVPLTPLTVGKVVIFCISSSQGAATSDETIPAVFCIILMGGFLENFTSNPWFCLRLRELRSANSLQHSGPHSQAVNNKDVNKNKDRQLHCRLKHKHPQGQHCLKLSHYLTKSFTGVKAELWKPWGEVKHILLKPLRRNADLLVCFSVQAATVFTPEVLPAEDSYWDPASSAFPFPCASLPSPPGLIQKQRPAYLQSRQSLCEQAQGWYPGVQLSTQQHVCDRWPLCGTHPSAYFSGLQLIITVLSFQMKYHHHMQTSVTGINHRQCF